MKQSNIRTSRRKAFTVIEILVVIAIIAILAAILFPVFAQAKEAAKKTQCLSNEKPIGIALAMYTVCPTVRSVGYAEMTDYRYLSKDLSVQQTVWSNGTVVTVNFGKAPFKLPNGTTVPPMGSVVAKAK